MDNYKERRGFWAKVKQAVTGLKTEKEVEEALTGLGIGFQNLTKEYGYLNIRIPRPNGYVRVYKPYKKDEVEVNSFDSVPMEWSGIPTFEPSGRRSF